MTTIKDTELAAAREVITAFVWERAEATRARTGVDWTFTPDAPNTYKARSGKHGRRP